MKGGVESSSKSSTSKACSIVIGTTLLDFMSLIANCVKDRKVVFFDTASSDSFFISFKLSLLSCITIKSVGPSLVIV